MLDELVVTDTIPLSEARKAVRAYAYEYPEMLAETCAGSVWKSRQLVVYGLKSFVSSPGRGELCNGCKLQPLWRE